MSADGALIVRPINAAVTPEAAITIPIGTADAPATPTIGATAAPTMNWAAPNSAAALPAR